jgi:hypothetical protein
MSDSPARPWWSLRRPAGVLFWGAALLFVAGVLLPLVHANTFRRGIQTALEGALGRRVEVGDVTLQLLTGPGFRLEDVVIGEDPAFGVEPFAHAAAMQARLRLRTLWTGQIQLASLTLEGPSINLVKNAAGKWNFETLLERAGAPAPSAAPATPAAQAEAAYFPYIGIDAGRVNFKFGDYKSLFHVQEVEAALSPPRDAGGRWLMRIGGRPARADELLPGMGRLTARGSLTATPPAGVARSVNLEIALENSPVAYLLRLIQGRDYGIHGDLAAQARLSGPLSGMGIQGTLEIGDVHRWDVTPGPAARVTVPLLGHLDLPRQELHLETGSASGAPNPVRVSLDLENYLSAPRWRGAVDLERAPTAPFWRIAQHFGVLWPEGLQLRGALAGRLEFPGVIWPTGSLSLLDGELEWPNSQPVQLGAAAVKVSGTEFQMPATRVKIGDEALEVTVSGRLSPLQVQAQVNARGVHLAAVRRYVETVKPGAFGGLLDGRWEGRVVYRKDLGSPGVWSGQGLLSDAEWQPEGLASPAHLAQARLRWEPGQFRAEPLAGSLGDTEFTGACSRRSPPDTPEQNRSVCQVRVRELDLGELEQWFHAADQPGAWAALKRALARRPQQPPAWLASLAVDGTLRIDHLRAGSWEFRNLQSRVAWGEGVLTLSAMRSELGAGTLTGGLRADFTGAAPRYSLQASARAVDLAGLALSTALPAQFQRGLLDVRLGLDTQGRTPQELRAALQLHGVFQAPSVSLDRMRSEETEGETGASWEMRQLEGGFTWTAAGLDLTRMRLTLGRDVYLGRGSIWGRPVVLLDLASGDRKLRLVSTELAEGVAEAP